MEKDFLKMAKGILILHGTEDEIVPIEPIKAFAGRNGIRFIPMEGVDHRFQNPKIMDSAIEKIVSFFGMI